MYLNFITEKKAARKIKWLMQGKKNKQTKKKWWTAFKLSKTTPEMEKERKKKEKTETTCKKYKMKRKKLYREVCLKLKFSHELCQQIFWALDTST